MYRLISLKDTLDIVFKKVFYKGLMGTTTRQNLVIPHQFGLRTINLHKCGLVDFRKADFLRDEALCGKIVVRSIGNYFVHVDKKFSFKNHNIEVSIGDVQGNQF